MLDEKKKARRISIISGKGGVGKTVITANLAAALALNRRRILVVDADLGLANLDIIMGLDPQYTIQDILSGARSLDEVILPTNKGFDLLPAGSGLADGTVLTTDMAEKVESLLNLLDYKYDTILFDGGAGIGDVVLFFASLAQEILLVVTPEPTSLTDCYATIKILKKIHGRNEFLLLVNQANPSCPVQTGATIANHLQNVISQFIDSKDNSVNVHLIGSIPSDPAIPQSIQRRQLLAQCNPQAPATRLINILADSLQSRLASREKLPVPSSESQVKSLSGMRN
jgi:flagellar biosynthesis protein FlhG